MSTEKHERPTPSPAMFANHVLIYWRKAMDDFFTSIDRAAQAKGLTGWDVHHALVRGYGDDVADEWAEWADLENKDDVADLEHPVEVQS